MATLFNLDKGTRGQIGFYEILSAKCVISQTSRFNNKDDTGTLYA